MAARRSKVTMMDIARRSGVSLSTVSLALNDKPGLPPETRMRVIRAARELGYEFRRAAAITALPTTLQTVGMLVKRAEGDTAPPSANIFFSHVIAGIEAGCRQSNISLLYGTLPVDENNNSLEIPQLVNDPRIDGLVLVGNYIDERLDEAIRKRGIPVVLAEAFCSSGDYDSVTIANQEGAYTAVKYLIDRGHRDIAFLGSYPDSRISFRYRRQGYQQALDDCDIPHSYYGDCPHNNREAIITATRSLLTENPQITAILGCNDEVSLIAMHGVLESGKRVPDDVSIIGFDNNANTEYSIPPLATMNVDKFGLGRLAIQLMIARAENPDQGCVSMTLHTNLIERKSISSIKAPG